MQGKIKVLFICHGNICRSTMAESLFTHLVKTRGLDDRFQISSAATSREEIGNPPHHGTVSKLNSVGIPVIPHRAVQMTKEDYDKYDYLVGMDSENIYYMERITGRRGGKLHKLLEFAGLDRDVADPWYTHNFDAAYNDILKGCEGMLDYFEGNGLI